MTSHSNGASVVHALLIVERELPEVELRALVQRLDEDLVWTADQPREDFLVTVYRGTEVVVVSDVEHHHPVSLGGFGGIRAWF